MNRIVFFILCIASACGHRSHSREWMQDNGKIKVLSTLSQIGDLVKAVGGERVDSLILIQGDLDPHSYELVKGDDDKVARAQAIFYNGLGLEHGASLAALLHSEEKALAIGDAIREKAPDRILYRGSQPDPHIWMDISLWEEGIDIVRDRLTEIDPAGKAEYAERALAFHQEMQRADRAVQERLGSISVEKRYLVTSHDAFQYFVRAYLAPQGESSWHSRLSAPEGLAPDGQLSPLDLQRTLDFLKEHRVEVIFPESNVSRDSIRKIVSSAHEMGLDVVLCTEALYGDSLGGKPYVEAISHNAEIIALSLEAHE